MRIGQANSFSGVNPGFGHQGLIAGRAAPTANPSAIGPANRLSQQEMQVLVQVLLKFLQALIAQLNPQAASKGFPRQMGQNQNLGAAPGLGGGAWPQPNKGAGAPQATWANQAPGMGMNQNNNLLPAAMPRRAQATAPIPLSQPHERGLRAAGEDLQRIQNLAPMIDRVANRYNIPPSILAGIVSRETRGRNVIGDNGHGHGLAQVDSGSFGQWTRNWRASGMPAEEGLRKGAEIFANKREYLRNRFPNLTPDQLMTATLSAYNGGEGAVGRALQRGASTDSVTTGKDYARDVLNRASVFANQLPQWMPGNQ